MGMVKHSVYMGIFKSSKMAFMLCSNHSFIVVGLFSV